MSKPLVSIVIPTLNEEKYIEACIETLLKSDYPLESIEIIVVDGLSSDHTVEKASAYKDKINCFKIITNEARYTPHAFNLGIKNSSGKYILIISGHSTMEPNYISGLVDVMEEYNADLAGGVFEVKSKNDTPYSRAIKNVLGSKWGAGSSKSRVGVEDVEEADTASGMYRASIFDKVGLFDERLLRGQDFELSQRIRRVGGKIFVTPHVKYSYYCRDSLRQFLIHNIKHGYWVINTAKIAGFRKSLSLRHLIPLFFTLYVILLPFSVLANPMLTLTFSIPGILYLFLIGKECIKKKNTSFIANFATFSGLHFCYGLGSFCRFFGVNPSKLISSFGRKKN